MGEVEKKVRGLWKTDNAPRVNIGTVLGIGTLFVIYHFDVNRGVLPPLMYRAVCALFVAAAVTMLITVHLQNLH